MSQVCPSTPQAPPSLTEEMLLRNKRAKAGPMIHSATNPRMRISSRINKDSGQSRQRRGVKYLRITAENLIAVSGNRSAEGKFPL